MKITFLRHAHAYHDRDDVNRVLSPKGLQAAFSLRKQLLDCKFELVIHSSAMRTKETIDAIFYNQQEIPPMIQIDSIYLPSSEEDIKVISKAMMMMPFASPKELMKKTGEEVWDRYAEQAYQDIAAAIDQYLAKKVLLVGHGVIINLLGLKFSPQCSDLLDRYFGYLEGYSLNL